MKIKNTEIIITKGDITESNVEAIVNAANNKFYMGGGVAGAIKKKGGSLIEEEAIKQGPVEVGEAVITQAGALKAKYVIHAATMKMDFKTDEGIIRKATYNTLKLAQEKKISSIAFCALGCGVGGFSYEAASKIMAQEVFRYLQAAAQPTLKKIEFVLFSEEAVKIFQKNIEDYLKHITGKLREGPFLTVDGIVELDNGIVMIERINPPSGWALPGGFVDYGETVEAAVKREVKEETNLDFSDFKLLGVYSDPKRDARFHTVSTVFYGKGKGKLKAASDAKNVKIYTVDSLPEKIAFDHRQIIEDYKKRIDKIG
ncbi:MAG: macro domain-containing protein [Candidatus Omnitrophica bacterium]|jgi:O-acetyl-ADP-ribose deacetylase (regulator of RNase III)/ADP-ribose pyrophosphatase YjhB (NUDIX family)|nr:macro domain-containing protein [Candidatus Omnitrophota bacterium]